MSSDKDTIMNNQDILSALENSLSGEEVSVAVEKKIKFIIFNIDTRLYAMEASYVQEIILDYPVFYLPFSPQYVRGLINRHGEPYTVVDLKLLFHGQEIKASTFLVLRNSIDNLSFLISSIDKIENISESDVHPITSKDVDMDLFESSLFYEGNEIFVVNIKTVIERIINDIE
jgi:chemotaxis signal transduction protein